MIWQKEDKKPGQWSNIPHSFTANEDVIILKYFFHVCYTKFLMATNSEGSENKEYSQSRAEGSCSDVVCTEPLRQPPFTGTGLANAEMFPWALNLLLVSTAMRTGS